MKSMTVEKVRVSNWPKMGLCGVHEVYEKFQGKKISSRKNQIKLLEARIGELLCLLDEANCMVNAAKEHIDKLEGRVIVHPAIDD